MGSTHIGKRYSWWPYHNLTAFVYFDTSQESRLYLMVFLAFFVALPLSLRRNTESLTSFSLLSMMFYVFLAIKMFLDSLPALLNGNWFHRVVWWKTDNLLAVLPIFAMALAGKLLFLHCADIYIKLLILDAHQGSYHCIGYHFKGFVCIRSFDAILVLNISWSFRALSCGVFPSVEYSVSVACQLKILKPSLVYVLIGQPQVFEVFDLGSVDGFQMRVLDRTVSSAMHTCLTVYTVVGFFGYIGQYQRDAPLPGNSLLLLDDDSWMSWIFKMGFVASLIMSFPLCLFPCRTSLHSVIYRRVMPYYVT